MTGVILRGRSDIVGAMAATFPRFLARRIPKSRGEFPKRLTVEEAKVAATGGRLERLLAEFGALYLPATGADTAAKFQGLLGSLGLATVEYRGGLGHRASEPGTGGGGGGGGSSSGRGLVYSASDEPADFTIEMHNEKADTPDLPDVISFWCQVPAEEGKGGETVLLHSDSVLSGLDQEVLTKLENKQVCYWRRLKDTGETSYLSWQSVFHTDKRATAEDYLRQKRFKFRWENSASGKDSLIYWNVMPPTKKHPVSGRKVWCNSVQSHHSTYYSVHPTYRNSSEQPFTTMYGDQTQIEASVLQHIREVSWAGAIGFQLGRHDLVIADNHQVQHGRMSFTGERKLKVAISRPWTA